MENADISTLEKPDISTLVLQAQLSEDYLPMVQRTHLKLTSIGLERKAYFPSRPRFFDRGFCSRFGWTGSSADVELVVLFEQLLICL